MLSEKKWICNTPTHSYIPKQWSFEEAFAVFNMPFMELLYKAHSLHRSYFDPNQIQICTLLSIKSGSCPEDCAYCPQSAHYKTNTHKEALIYLDKVLDAAKHAKDIGSSRFCMGAAWRGPRDADLEVVCKMIQEVKNLGLETCATLGLLNKKQAVKLKEAGLDYYNHNIDTSPEYYNSIITTRTFNDRLETIQNVRQAGIRVCCGGILGMGESNADRVKMLVVLANLAEPPESIPINKLVRIKGTPLAGAAELDSLDFVRTVALARIMLSTSYIRLSAGRSEMSEELQALCFFAGANSMFYGEKLLTTPNAMPQDDEILLRRLGLKKLLFERVGNESDY